MPNSLVTLTKGLCNFSPLFDILYFKNVFYDSSSFTLWYLNFILSVTPVSVNLAILLFLRYLSTVSLGIHSCVAAAAAILANVEAARVGKPPPQSLCDSSKCVWTLATGKHFEAKCEVPSTRSHKHTGHVRGLCGLFAGSCEQSRRRVLPQPQFKASALLPAFTDVLITDYRHFFHKGN